MGARMISSRLDDFGDEIFASLNVKRRALEATGANVIDLSVGTPDFEPPAHVKNALIEAAKDSNNWKYALHDTDELLEAVCAYYKHRYGVDNITKDMVMSCRGTQEGMLYSCLAFSNPGDTVLLPDPCYPVFQNASKLARVNCVFYPLLAEHDFLPYVADIDPEVADAAKYMIVSLPANPVGSVGTKELYLELIEFARKHDIVLIHDNAYSDIVFDGVQGGSFLSYPGAQEVGVEYFSLSKSFNVTGARLSFLVGNSELVAAARKLRSQVDFGMFLPEQAAAIACLTGPLESVIKQQEIYQQRRDVLSAGIESLGWGKPSAKGSMFVWAKLPEGAGTSFDFCEKALDAAHVLMTPGASFGPSGEGYVRFALVQDTSVLEEACKRLDAAGFSAN